MKPARHSLLTVAYPTHAARFGGGSGCRRAAVMLIAVAIGLVAALSNSSAAPAAKKPGEAVKVHETKIKGAAAPGSEVMAVLVFEVDQGYHIHSNKPSEPNFIPTVLTVQATNGVTAGAIVYPKGKPEKVDGLAKPLSVYEKQFTVSVPLKLDAAIKLPQSVPVSLRYQACQGSVCYPPKTLKAEIQVTQPAK